MMKGIATWLTSVSLLEVTPFVLTEDFLKYFFQTLITGFTIYYQWKQSKIKKDGQNTNDK